MTDTAGFLERLRQVDIRLALDGERLAVNAPKGAITPELRDELTRRKEEVLAHLRRTAPRVPPPLERVERGADVPLSHSQQRLWIIKRLDPDSRVYNISGMVRITGPLDVAAFERTLNDIVERHETLRTRFVTVEGEPRCVIEPRATVNLERIDLTDVPEGERPAAMMAAARTFARRPIDLTRVPLLLVALIKTAADEHVFVPVLDHIAADGLSIVIFLIDLQALYALHALGRGTPPAPLAIQYLDYADWERRVFAQGGLDDTVAYWKKQLAGLPAVLQLPTDRPRPPVQTHRGARASAVFPRELGERLRALGRDEGATLFMVLLAGFQALLHRYSGETDFAVGSAIANRDRPEVQKVIGFFANNLVLRADVSGNPTGRELIARVREVSLKAYANQSMPFDMLIDALATRRELDHSPIFQVMFVLQRVAFDGLELPGVRCETIEPEIDTARFDLVVDVYDVPAGLRVFFEYNTDLFDAATMSRMLAHFQRLLEGLASQPGARVSELPILTPAEERELLVEANPIAADYPREATVHSLFEAQVARAPDAVAVHFEDERITYRELDARANRLAHHLRSLGVGPGSLAGVWLERSADMIVAVMGVLKAGGAYVPLDPAFPRERIDYMMSDAALAAVVTDERLAATLGESGPPTVCFARDAALLARQPETPPVPLAGVRDLAYVIYTSGSTGRPKGVEIEHRSVVNFLASMHREPGIGASDRVLSVTTLSFDIAGLEIHGPLTAGGTVILAPRAIALDGTRLAGLLESSAATMLQATPATWKLLLESGWRGRPGLKMLCGGEAMPRELAANLVALGGELWNMYGPTETTIWSTIARVADTTRAIPIGRPIANTQVYVLEPSGLPAPVGVGGELCIGGDGLARGYRNRPELTSEKFVTLELPGVGATRVYRTGDIVRFRADGEIEYVGRRDHQVKLRGFRIELGEVEETLRRHDSVADVVVDLRGGRGAGQGEPRLVAYVVHRPGEAPTVSEMRRFLRGELPEHMVPSIISTLEAIPLTPNGKVDRAALPDPFRNARSSEAHEPPAAGIESLLARVWGELVEAERVGAHDNFFELGGHSLLAIRAANAVEKETGWRMDPRTMFFQTLRQVAAAFPGDNAGR